jgi:hypothetical protein
VKRTHPFRKWSAEDEAAAVIVKLSTQLPRGTEGESARRRKIRRFTKETGFIRSKIKLVKPVISSEALGPNAWRDLSGHLMEGVGLHSQNISHIKRVVLSEVERPSYWCGEE